MDAHPTGTWLPHPNPPPASCRALGQARIPFPRDENRNYPSGIGPAHPGHVEKAEVEKKNQELIPGVIPGAPRVVFFLFSKEGN